MSDFWSTARRDMSMPLTYLVAGVVVAVLVGLVTLSKWSAKSGTASKQTQEAIQRLVTQAAQYGSSAAQDSSIVLRLLHVNYAVAYLRAAKLLASESELRQATSVDVFELQQALEDQQQAEIRLLATECPALKIDSNFSIAAGWVA